MTNVVARDLGYKNIVNISYSQSGSDEQTIAQQVALKLGNPLYCRSLDDATFLYDLEDTVYDEFGVAHYDGITGGRQFLQLIGFEKFGLEHTGQIGDVVLSQFYSRTSNSFDINSKRDSDLLLQRFPLGANEFSSNEEYAFYTRAFQGALSTHYIRANYTYAVSPFLDPGLISFCASLPDSIRANHRLYWNWIDQKYQVFGGIPSSRLRHYPGMGLQRFLYFVATKLKVKTPKRIHALLRSFCVTKISTTPNNMNPFQYWYDTNEELKTFIDDYYLHNKHFVESHKLICSEVRKMYRSSNVFDKIMAISLLGTIKIYT